MRRLARRLEGLGQDDRDDLAAMPDLIGNARHDRRADITTGPALGRPEDRLQPVLTRFTHGSDFPAPLSDAKDPKSPRVGKLTHPCGAPDNHLLTVWAGGSMPSSISAPFPRPPRPMAIR